MTILGKRKKILLVEDDTAIRDVLNEILTMEGFEVEEAENGQVGIQKLESGLKPNLILLDLMMPIKDGVQFRREQMANPKWQNFPVIVLSANANLEEKLAQIGGNLPSIKKPPNLDDVISKVATYCR